MFFLFVFIIGLVIPFIFIKAKRSWVKWIPAISLFLAAILIYGKTEFFPGEGMADLGERISFMIVGISAIGSILGGIIVHFLKNK